MKYSYIYNYEFLLKFSFHARISFCATFCYWRSLVLGAKNFAFCSTNFSRKIICTQRKIVEYCAKVVPLHAQIMCKSSQQKLCEICAKKVAIPRKPPLKRIENLTP